MKKKCKTGGMANPNKSVQVQRTAGSKGVGTTKSTKVSVQKSPGGRVGGTNKSVKVSPK